MSKKHKTNTTAKGFRTFFWNLKFLLFANDFFYCTTNHCQGESELFFWFLRLCHKSFMYIIYFLIKILFIILFSQTSSVVFRKKLTFRSKKIRRFNPIPQGPYPIFGIFCCFLWYPVVSPIAAIAFREQQRRRVARARPFCDAGRHQMDKKVLSLLMTIDFINLYKFLDFIC